VPGISGPAFSGQVCPAFSAGIFAACARDRSLRLWFASCRAVLGCMQLVMLLTHSRHCCCQWHTLVCRSYLFYTTCAALVMHSITHPPTLSLPHNLINTHAPFELPNYKPTHVVSLPV
jgi:hypothetical protein